MKVRRRQMRITKPLICFTHLLQKLREEVSKKFKTFLKRRIVWIRQIGEHPSPIRGRNEGGVPVVSAASANLRITK